MKKIISLLLLAACPGYMLAQEETKATLNDAEKVYGLSQIWSEAKYNFVYYDRLGFDWDSLYRATIPVVLETQNLFDYYDVLIRFAVRLGDGHTNVWGPGSFGEERWNMLPLEFHRFGDQVYLKTVGNRVMADAGLRIGDEVLAINGRKPQEYAAEYLVPRIHTSTPQWLDASLYEKGALTRGRREESFRIRVKHRTGEVRDHTFRRGLKWEPDMYSDPKHFGFTVLEGNIGHLILRRFYGEDFEEKFAEVLPKILQTDGLIIDVRYNDGGNTNFAYHVLKQLALEPFQGSAWGTREYKPAFRSWNMPEEWYFAAPRIVEPAAADLYTAPVAVLIDHETFSAGEDFCVAFRNMGRGLMIGRPTAGSTGNPLFFELPGGGSARICTKKDTYPDGTEFVGIGVLPDITVVPTLESLLSGEDLYLKKALEVIRSESTQ